MFEIKRKRVTDFKAYTKAGLPSAGSAGRIARVTDDIRGLWMDNGSQWFSLRGGVIDVMEFGATGDGSTDDTSAIQDALDALPAEGGTVYFPTPSVAYSVTSTLTISEKTRLRIICGASQGGYDSEVFLWNGSNGGTVLLLDRCRDSIVDGLSIWAGSGTIGIGIRIDHASAPTGGLISSNLTLRNILIGESTCGIQIGNSSTGNNAEHVLDNVWITGAGTYGVYIYDSQSKNIRFREGGITDRTSGIYQNNGSIKVWGTVFANNTADINLRDANDSILIEGCYTEGSEKFLDTGGPSGNAFNVSLINNQIQPDGVGADNIIIRYRFLGTFVMQGNNFGGAYYASVKVDVGTSNTTSFFSSGNTYLNSTPFSSSGGAKIYTSLNDLYLDASSVAQKMANTITNGLTVDTLSITQGAIISGTWTPTVTAGTNVASVPSQTTGNYHRVGSVVTCSFRVDVVVTAASTYTQVDITPPVASTLPGDNNGPSACTATYGGAAFQSGIVVGNTNKLTASFISPVGSAGNQISVWATVTYLIS